MEHSDRIIEGLRFVFIELPKFKPVTMAEKKMAVLWLRFLTEIDEKTEEAPTELLENAETSKALSIVEKSAFNDQQLYAYEQFWDAVINEQVLIEGGYKKGLADGEAKGEAKGRAEGLAEGEVKRAEERLTNAKALLANNVPLEVIVNSLHLTGEEAAKLQS